ncbi:PHP domain-containing protein [Methanosarcina barkeri]|uniref:PHP domain-containing protein n=1 Tax=Methanosarcina barkeri TaxID=2208 RepID=UPI000AFB71F6|nr:hypothetical protein [Methanosarcina barkeri]
MGRGPKNYEEKLITPEQAVKLIEEGWRRADLHVHTTCSFDVLPARDLNPESLYEKALKMGMDYVTFTDHDTIEAYEILGWDHEKLVPGVEISVYDPEFAGTRFILTFSSLTGRSSLSSWKLRKSNMT